jgi:hypothetical protein
MVLERMGLDIVPLLAGAGIEIPLPHGTFYFGDTGKSIDVALKGQAENHETEEER